MLPAIASFFGVSTDELFDFNLFEMEKTVETICDEAYRYRFTDAKKKAEAQFRIAAKIIDAFEEDFPETELFNKTIYEYSRPRREELEGLMQR